MKHTTINGIILATALSVAGVTHAIAAATDSSGATNAEQSCVYKEDGRGKHHGGKRHGGQKNKRMSFKNLDLTAEQKASMKTIMEAHKEAGEASRSAHKAEMKALLDTAEFNEEKATTLIADREAQRAEKKLEMLKVKHEMYQLLTDEQKAKYDERKAKSESKGRGEGKGKKA